MLPARLPVLSALLLLLLLLLLGSGGRAAGLTGNEAPSPGRDSRAPRGLDGHLRDPRHKEKYIRHLTGPLYFNPKCRKHFNRVYHSTRDCTVPAFYKRCARLLIRLANSPRCVER